MCVCVCAHATVLKCTMTQWKEIQFYTILLAYTFWPFHGRDNILIYVLVRSFCLCESKEGGRRYKSIQELVLPSRDPSCFTKPFQSLHLTLQMTRNQILPFTSQWGLVDPVARQMGKFSRESSGFYCWLSLDQPFNFSRLQVYSPRAAVITGK